MKYKKIRAKFYYRLSLEDNVSVRMSCNANIPLYRIFLLNTSNKDRNNNQLEL